MQPQEIQDRRFSTAFRGYDPTEVRQFLAHVAGLFSDLQARVEPTEKVTAMPVDGAAEGAVVDGEQSDATVGNEGEPAEPTPSAAEVLAQAQHEADDLLAAARTEAQTIVARANDEAARVVLRARAESRGKPSAERNAAIEAALAEVPGDPEQAREQARLMISEARAVRERILSDLAKRRRTAHVQLEQLRVAREKLLETLRDARRVVEDASRDLSTAEVEARLAAETAGRRVSSEPMPGVEELEAELFGGRFLTSADSSGRPLVGTVSAPAAVEQPAEVEVVAEEVEVVVVEVVAEVVADAPSAAEPEVVVVDDVATDDVATDEVAADDVATDEVDAADSEVVAETAEEESPSVVSDDEDSGEVTQVESTDLTEVVAVEIEPAALVDGPESDATHADAPAAPKRSVDDLFARLRAERTEAADRARVELAKPPAPQAPASPEIVVINEADHAETADGITLVESATNESIDETGEVIEAEGVHELAVVIDVTGRVGASVASSAATSDGTEIDATLLLEEPSTVDPGMGFVTDDLGQDPTNVTDLVTQRVSRAIKRHLRDEQGSALVALRTARGMPHIDALLGTDDEQRARLREALDGAVEGEVGLHPSRAAAIAHDIAGAIRREVATALTGAANGTSDVTDLPELIASAYRVWTIERLDALVRPGVAISA